MQNSHSFEFINIKQLGDLYMSRASLAEVSHENLFLSTERIILLYGKFALSLGELFFQHYFDRIF